MGALHIYTRDPDRDFDEIDRDLAQILATQVGVAIVNARLVTQLRDTDEAREQFLSIVSHELRTPLTPLKALAQLQLARLKRSQERGTPMDLEALARNLESIERQVDRMNGLVNDLLSVSRAGKGTLDMDRAPFDLAAELRDVVGRYVAATREEGRHSFTVDTPETLVYDGDQSRIDQLLMNLVGNAVKYSPRGGRGRGPARAAGRRGRDRDQRSGHRYPRSRISSAWVVRSRAGSAKPRPSRGWVSAYMSRSWWPRRTAAPSSSRAPARTRERPSSPSTALAVCRRRESNPHGPCDPTDFESVSAAVTTLRRRGRF